MPQHVDERNDLAARNSFFLLNVQQLPLKVETVHQGTLRLCGTPLRTEQPNLSVTPVQHQLVHTIQPGQHVKCAAGHLEVAPWLQWWI